MRRKMRHSHPGHYKKADVYDYLLKPLLSLLFIPSDITLVQNSFYC